MPHKVYAIERFGGEAPNNDGRMTSRPIRLHGRFNRAGGVTAGPRLSVGSTDYNMIIGYDWLGISAWRNASTNRVFGHFYQDNRSGAHSESHPSVPFVSPAYWPGGAVIDWRITLWNSSLAPVDFDVFYLAPDGNWYTIRNGTLGLNFGLDAYTESGSGDWEFGDCVTFLAVFFVEGMFGWVPVGWQAKSVPVPNVGGSVKYEVYMFNYISPPPCGRRVIVYANFGKPSHTGCQPGTSSRYMWSKIADYREDRTFSKTGYVIRSSFPEPNSLPTFHYPIQELSPLGYKSKLSTYSHARTFVGGSLSRSFSLRWRCGVFCNESDAIRLRIYICRNKRGVLYSDPGFIGYSEQVNEIRIDDLVNALVPSSNGIYIASTQGIWEAVGDFTTTATTIRQIPVGYGVDGAINANVAFNGREAFFVKHDSVFSIGPGGIKNIGQPERNRSRDDSIGITYDRRNDRLLSSDVDGTLKYYDSISGQWAELFGVSNPTSNTPFIPIRYSYGGDTTEYQAGDSIVTVYESEPANGFIYAEWSNLDMNAPGLKKRIHTIRIPHNGKGASPPSVSVEIRPTGTTPWLPCVVRDRGREFEARCPTAVSDAFDVKIEVNGVPTEDFAINPPIIIGYELRERDYAKD